MRPTLVHRSAGPESGRSAPRPVPRNRETDQYKLLIITTDQYAESFTELTDMYFERGIKSQIASKESINETGTGQDLQEKIRNYIIDQYQNNGVEFVLLGGDVELIPYRGFYCYVESGGGYEEDGIPADLYYSALDGNWNDDGDNKWGEPDEDDLLPDVAVARFPFSTAGELENLIHKSHYYQDFPVTGELTNALMAGEYLYSNPDTWGNDYLELLIGEHSDNGYTTNGIPEDYNFEKLYEENQSWSKYDLMNAINSGKQFVHHVGHASQTYVAYMYNSDITNANFSGANGIDHNYTLLQSHGCDCGAFDYNDCILEKMVNIDNFAVAVMGNSRYGWFNEGQTEGPSAHMHREMVDALYNDEIRFLGEAFKESKIQTAPWVEADGQWEEGALRWNFYDLNILGDPAMSVWTNEPISIDATYASEVVIGTSSTEVSVMSNGFPMENFVCTIMKENVICGIGITDATGTATITFTEDITQPGDANLIVVGRNCLPANYELQFIPGGEAYVVFNQVEINDEEGNNNQLADYSETIMLNVSVENVGLAEAENVMVTLRSNDTYISITDSTENYGNIAAQQEMSIENGFTFVVNNNIPDQHEIEFTLHCQSGANYWESVFTIQAQAPQLVLGSPVISDLAGGNNSGSFDPGETDTLTIDASNLGHSDCFNAQISLSTVSPYATITPSSLSLENLEINQTKKGSFQVEIDSDTPLGTIIEFNCTLISGEYQTTSTYYLPVGLIMEDFESGDFSQYDWLQNGDEPWIVTGEDPYEGNYSARSGLTDDNKTSELEIEIEVMNQGTLTFLSKISSEVNYDFLRFYVDETELAEWSGQFDWTEQTFQIDAGIHTFKWSYEKDVNNIEGADAAWLDNIVFPPASTILGVNPSTESYASIQVYPNPAKDQLFIKADKGQIDEVTIFNMIGSKVHSFQSNNFKTGTVQLDVSSIDLGLYLIEIIFENQKITKKLIIQ